jgi:putative DNA primase/helicase
MVAENYDDVLSQLQSIGLIIGDRGLEFGQMVRCKVDGARGKPGWYSLHEVPFTEPGPLQGKIGIFGAFGIWRGNEHNPQKIEFKRSELSVAQREAIRARMAEDKKRADARRRREIERAADRARSAWERLKPAGTCGYLDRKGVKAYGLRFTDRGNMAVPMLDERGRIFGLQVIYGDESAKKRIDRDKDFWPTGLAKKGTFFLIGSPIWIIIVAEGYATAASIHEATGYPVAVAFDAGNLLPVAQALHKRYPWARILIGADDDFLAKCPNKECAHVDIVDLGACPKCATPYGHGNTGVESAAAAALAVGGAWVKPTFSADRGTDKITDFNDLHAREGLHAVRSQIEAKLLELEWKAKGASAVGDNDLGGGENKALKSLLTVEEAAVRYSLVYGGKGTLFDHQEHQLVPKTDVLDLLEDHGWRDWKRHPGRKVVRLLEVGFDPAGTDANIKCNLWGGWPTTPKAGKCDALLELLEYLCSGEPNANDVYKWVLNWLAYPIQHHGAKMKTALIFHGPQGVGKNLFFDAIKEIYGRYGLTVDQSAIEDKHNDWASAKLFLIADEVVARQELYHTKNKLKGFITNPDIRINPKHVAAHEEINHVNVVFLSNETQPLVLEKDDRRYTVIWTPDTLSDGFYQDIAKEIDAGAIAALHDYLLRLDLGDFKPWTKPPATKAKQDLIDVSLDSTQRFLRDWEQGETPYPVGPAKSMDLYAAYLRWCRLNGVTKPRDSSQFLGYVGKLRGWKSGPVWCYENTHYKDKPKQRRVVIPDEETLARLKKSRDETKSMAHWVTDGICDFAMALEDQNRSRAFAANE